MSIFQLDIYGRTKVETAIERCKRFEPKDGYYLAFSGGKDSVVVKALADMAGVKYDAHYAITSVDPPELVRFIKDEHPDVIRERQYWKTDGVYHKAGDPITMWNLIPHKGMPPTRLARYCCQYLKEQGGRDRFVITGVRWAESAKRKKYRAGLELSDKLTGDLEHHDPDSEELKHTTQKYARRGLNPIVDWTNDEVWEFIREYSIPYCKLYDKGYKRLGCIGCPVSAKQAVELNDYPKFKQAYLHSFERMLKIHDTTWNTAEEVMAWWTQWNDQYKEANQ